MNPNVFLLSIYSVSVHLSLTTGEQPFDIQADITRVQNDFKDTILDDNEDDSWVDDHNDLTHSDSSDIEYLDKGKGKMSVQGTQDPPLRPGEQLD